jgi:hypothetical protein
VNELEEIEEAIDRLPLEDIRRSAQWLRDREKKRQDECQGTAYREMALDRSVNATRWNGPRA